MMKRILLGFMLIATASGCGKPNTSETAVTPVALKTDLSDEELAVQTLNQMLQVAEKGDWGAYVDNHYGEQDRYRSPSDRDIVVKRFQDKWGKKLLPVLRRAVQLPVRIDGDLAVFMDGEETIFFLYRGQDGNWTFHL